MLNVPSNIPSIKENSSQLRTADYSGISVGTKWTVNINNSYYMSFSVTNISSTSVYADYYVNGQPQWNIKISDVYIQSDAWVSTAVSSEGTYNDTYGGRLITVCKVSMVYEYVVVDIDTGIVVEINSSLYTLILTSWGLYGEVAISGYSWVVIFPIIIGSFTYILKKKIPKEKLYNN